MRNNGRWLRCAALLMAVALMCSGCEIHREKSVRLNPAKPVTVTVWHYYNGIQQIAFDRLVDQFNEGVGREKGIFVKADSKGNVSDLEKEVLASFRGDVGASETPDIFSSYADTAYAVDQLGKLVDLEQYLTAEELAEYVDSFVEEGRIGQEGELRIFPTAKSSEVFMLSRTDWDVFANATGASLDDLATKEGLTRTARAYYEWTDSLTPDVPNDGRAFFGRDAMANLFIIGSMQFGVELFKVENGRVSLQIDEAVMRKIWDGYYVPFVRGYFSAYGRFRSDDVKLGEIIAYVGSTSSANYFPDVVEDEHGSREIDYMILPVPEFEGGSHYAVQQGAGMVVTKSVPERELAAVTFLKWLTQDENNLLFSCTSGYVPVKKAALDKTLLHQTIESRGLVITSQTYDAIVTCIDMMQSNALYTNKAFEHGVEARSVLENHLAQKAAADREVVQSRLAQGMSLDEAAADLTGDDAFAAWLADFTAAMHAAVDQ